MLIKLKEMIPCRLKKEVKRFLKSVWESSAYRFTGARHSNGPVYHVVFVCHGNICRSAFAEHYLKMLLPDHNIKIESCGLDADRGGVSPPVAVQVGKEFGVDLSVNLSKGVNACDMQNADLIVTMEYGQSLRLKATFPDAQNKINLLREFAPWPDRLSCNIYDPYGFDVDEFQRCFQKIKRALEGLKCQIENNQ